MNRKRAVLIGLGASLLGLWAAAPARAAEPADWEAASAAAFDTLAPADPSAGGDPRAWRAALATQAGLRHALEPGVDLVFSGDGARVVAMLRVAGALATRGVTFDLPGAQGFVANAHGHARLSLPDGDLAFVRPGAAEDDGSGLRAVAAQWTDAGAGRLGLSFPAHAGKLPLLVRFEVVFLSDPEAVRRYDRNRDGRVDLSELGEPAARTPEGGATVTATMADALVVDTGTPGQANPTDVIEYTVNVTAQGGTATGLAFGDTLDPDTTPVGGTLNVSPLALDDTYNAVGNLTLNVTSAVQGILGNDREFLSDTFTLTSPAPGVPTATSGGGSITVNADGTFSYTPPTVGTTDTLNYTITDPGGLTGTGTATFNIAGRVWFVDRDAPGGGTGTQASPFNLLAAVNGAGGVGDPDGPNDILYLHDRAAVTDYVGGLELEAGQRLVGSGVPLIINGTTYLPATAPPAIENTAGNALTLIAGVTVDGRPHVEGLTILAANNAAIAGTGVSGTVDLDNVAVSTSGSGAGLSLTNQAGTLTFNGSIGGSGTGAALALSGGAGSVTLTSAPINKTAGRLVDVQNKTGGTVTFGTLSGTGAATDAVVVQNNTGGTVFDFGSGLSVTTTSGRGLLANNGGTLNIAGTASTISATGGAALDVTGTSFGGGVTFASVSSSGSSAEGVKLANVTGPVTINGGAVSGSTGTAFSLAQGSANVTYAGTISKTSAGRAVDVQTRAGGTATFSGAITATGASTGINVSGATAASTVTFTDAVDLGTAGTRLTGGTALTVNHGGTSSSTSFADLDVFTTGQAGIDASNGGTLNVTTGSVDAGGRALSLDGVALGATLTSATSAGSAAEGVRLNSATGSLSIGTTGVTGPSTQGILVQGSSATVNFASSGSTTVSGGGTQRILVTTSTGNVSFGNTTVSGGTDGVSLQNNSAGTRTFGTLSVSGNSGIGLLHAVGGGATNVTGATTITNPGGTGVDIQNSASSVTFNGVTVNKGASAGTGVNLASNTTAPNFGTLAITASNGTGLASNNSGIVNGSGSIAATNGPAINASATAFSSTFATVSSTNSASQGINLSGPTGTLTMSGGAISGSAGTAFNVSGGSAAVTHAGSVTQNNAQRVVDVQNTTGGGVSLGTVTGGASSTGVNINAANGNVTFTSLTHGTSGTRTANQAVTINGGTGTYSLGTVSIFTTGGTAKGISALNADGALNSTAGTVNAAGAPAIDIDGPAGLTTLGMTLTTVSANGGGYGLRIQDTNGAAGFSVTGDGGGSNNGSGGTISGMTGANMSVGGFELPGNGVYLRNAQNIALGYMNVSGSQNNGVFGDDVTGFTLVRSNITNSGTITGLLEAGLRFYELLGSASVTNSTISGSFESNMLLTPASGVLGNLTISGSTIGPNSVTTGLDGLQINGSGTADVTVVVTGTVFTGNRSGGVSASFLNNSKQNWNISGSTFQNQTNAISLITSDNADLTYDVHDNPTILNSSANAMNLVTGNANNAAAIRGRIQNNVIGNGTADSGSVTSFGIAVDMQSDQDAVINVAGNTVSNTDIEGIFVQSRLDNDADAEIGLLDLTLRNNVVNTPDDNSAFPFFTVYGVRLESRNTSNLCLDINANDSASVGGFEHFRTRQRDTSTYRVERLALGAQTAATMAAHVAAQNVAGSTASATAATSYTGVADGTCRTHP
jgi:hypothetical protein